MGLIEFQFTVSGLLRLGIRGEAGLQNIEIREDIQQDLGIGKWIAENKPCIGDTLKITMALEKR